MFSVALDISALDPAFKEHAQRGIGRYVRELKSYFDGFKHDVVDVRYFSHQELFDASGVEKFLRALPAGVNTIRQQVAFPLQLARKTEWSFVHFPAHMDSPIWGPTPRIVTVLDLIPLVLESLYRPDGISARYRFARMLENRAILSARHLIAISECTKRDIIRMLGVPEERITVTPLGVDDKFFQSTLIESETALRARIRLPQQRPILLYVGGIDQRKNVSWMVETFAELLAELRRRGTALQDLPVLCLVGSISGDKQYPRLLEVIQHARVGGDVSLVGFLSDEDLMQLMSISRLFFFPSLYEGFGLPPLEALAAGLPVLALNAAAMPEVLSGCAELVDPGDQRAAVEGLLRLLAESSEVRRERIEKGRERARRFSWQRTGELTFQVYERLAVGKR